MKKCVARDGYFYSERYCEQRRHQQCRRVFFLPRTSDTSIDYNGMNLLRHCKFTIHKPIEFFPNSLQ